MKLHINKIPIVKIIAFSLLFAVTSYSQISIKAVGDIMLGSVTPREIIPKDSGYVFVRSIGKYLRGSDIVLGNLEGTFFTGEMQPVKCSDSARANAICFEFGMPDYLSKRLKMLGFTALDLDNNHSEDYGIAGYEFTISRLNQLGIVPVQKRKLSVIHSGHKNIALVAFGFSGGSYKISDLPEASQIISNLKKKYKIIIVMFHGGAEGKNATHVRNNTEIYLNENRGNEIAFAKTVIDAGADLVIGSGPHVLRALHLYKNKLIAYSMGNFLTYGNINIAGINGISAILSVVIDSSNGNFVDGEIIPVIQRGRGIPYFDNYKGAVNIINKLILEDFPDSNIFLSSEGKILRRIINIPPYITFYSKLNINNTHFSLKRVKVPETFKTFRTMPKNFE